jgi:hypothetical protein
MEPLLQCDLVTKSFVSRTWSSSGPGGSRNRLLTVEETCWEVGVFNNGPRALSRTVPASGRQLRYTCGMGHLLGYGRVSAAEQNAELQTDELTTAGWRLAVPDVTFSGGEGSVLQHDLGQRALLVTEEAEHACGKLLGVGERGRCPLHPDGVHHLQRAARRIRCLRHRDRGVVVGLGRPASCCATSTGSCGRRRCRCWRPTRWIASAPAAASHQMTPPPDPASPRLRSGQRLDVHTRAGSEGGCGPSRRSCWGRLGSPL